MTTVIDGTTGVNRVKDDAVVGGDLVFAGPASRIYGDFSSGSPSTNRLMFQSNVANGNTVVGAIPNGTAKIATFTVYSNPAIDNASFLQLATGYGDGAGGFVNTLDSGKNGSGTYLPLTFNTGGMERFRLSATENRFQADFTGNPLMFQTSAANSGTTFGIVPNGTAKVAIMSCYDNNDINNAAYFAWYVDGGQSNISSSKNGTGTVKPISFQVGGVERANLRTDGCLVIQGQDVGTRLDLRGNQADNVQAVLTRGFVDTQFQLWVQNGGASAASGTPQAVLALVYPGQGYNGEIQFRRGDSPTNGDLAFCTNNHQLRMLIRTDGYVLIGDTAPLSPNQGGRFGVRSVNKAASFLTDYGSAGGNCAATFGRSNDGNVCEFYHVDGARGNISVTASGTAFVTTSDYRLKDDIQDFTASGIIIDALKPRTWTWKETGKPGLGFVAHEVAELIPDAVIGEKDGIDIVDGISPKYQGFACGSPEMMAIMVAELKSLRARVAALEEAL